LPKRNYSLAKHDSINHRLTSPVFISLIIT